MNLLDRLTSEFALVTPEQIAVASASLGPVQEGEERLLTVTDRPDIERLWALAHEYDKRGALAAFEAKFNATSERAKKAAVTKIAQLNGMESLLRDLAWVAIRDISPSLYEVDCLSLRAGFVVVKIERPAAQANRKLQQFLERLGLINQPEDDEDEDEGRVQ